MEEGGGQGEEMPGVQEAPEVPEVPGGQARRRRVRRGARAQGRSRQVAAPEAMTKVQLAQHRREGHVNYHPGCKHCVMARALADKHLRVEEDAEEVGDDSPPVVSADFCFRETARARAH